MSILLHTSRYAEFIAKIDIDTLQIIKGSLPKPQIQAVRDWASSRQIQLNAAWSPVPLEAIQRA